MSPKNSKSPGFVGKTSQGCSLLSAPVKTRLSRYRKDPKTGKWKRAAILKPFYAALQSGGTAERGEYSTLNCSGSPNDGSDYSGCSLASLLEPNAPRKYWLSAKVCAGILRRAEKRGRTLPPLLLAALQAVAQGAGKTLPPDTSSSDASLLIRIQAEQPSKPQSQATSLPSDGTTPAVPIGTAGALMGQCGGRNDFETETFIIQDCRKGNKDQNGLGITKDGPAYTLQANNHMGVVFPVNGVTDTLSATDGGPSASNLGRVVAFGCKDSDPCGKGDPAATPTLRSRGEVAIAFGEHRDAKGTRLDTQEDLAYTLRNPGAGGRADQNTIVTPEYIVRRLTPLECERLMGWADGTTAIKIKNGVAVAQADAPRYRGCGNGVVRPVARYVARRLKKVMEQS